MDRGNPGKINTWLNGSSFYMKSAEPRSRSRLITNRSLILNFGMEMDKDTLKSLASILGVTMQQLDMNRWAILKQIYEQNRLEHNMLKKIIT